jgi:hypothetical protein
MRAVLNYDNSIKEAQLQNNSLLAEIAYNALQQQLELSLQGIQYKNQLLRDKTKQKMEVDNMYYNRYQDVLQQINHENSMAEQIRQFNENKAMEQAKLAEQQRQFNASLAEEQRQYNESLAWQKSQAAAKAASSGGGGSGKSSSGGGSSIKKSSSGSSSKKSGGSTIQKPNAKKAGYTDTGSGNKNLPIDFNSITAAGYAGRSAAEINRLVEAGILEEYVAGGKRKFRKSSSAFKQEQLYKGLYRR